jgi:hypothetical protein
MILKYTHLSICLKRYMLGHLVVIVQKAAE